MGTGSGQLHEAAADLSRGTRDMHRALLSLMEELEAVDWYGQRVDACSDEQLRRVLVHNRDEEKEHACMTLEWIRRHDPVFDHFLQKLLFQPESESIVRDDEDAADVLDRKDDLRADPSLGIRSLREQEDAA